MGPKPHRSMGDSRDRPTGVVCVLPWERRLLVPNIISKMPCRRHCCSRDGVGGTRPRRCRASDNSHAPTETVWPMPTLGKRLTMSFASRKVQMVSLKMLPEIMFVIHRAEANVWISWEEQAVGGRRRRRRHVCLLFRFWISSIPELRFPLLQYFYSAEWICCE